MGKRLFLLLILSIGAAFITCSKKATQTASEYYESADLLFETENYTGAIQQFNNLVKFYPDDSLAVKALFSVAEIYKNNLTDLKKAIDVYHSIVKSYPTSDKAPNAFFMIGYIYANELHNYEKAEEAYKAFIARYPGHTLVMSAQWELDNLGKSLDEIPTLQNITKGQ